MIRDAHSEDRLRLARNLSRSRDVSDPRVIEAFRTVPRHEFLPAPQRPYAYQDRALPLGEGQTVSQPTMIAIMLEALECQSTHRALEVGAGSGYAAALLAQLVDSVDAVELRPALAALARHNLERLGITNVAVHQRDGCRGLPERGSYDRIMVSAGATTVPAALLGQLAPGGRIAIPVGAPGGSQRLHIGSNTPSGIEWTRGVACVFVPLVQND